MEEVERILGKSQKMGTDYHDAYRSGCVGDSLCNVTSEKLWQARAEEVQQIKRRRD